MLHPEELEDVYKPALLLVESMLEARRAEVSYRFWTPNSKETVESRLKPSLEALALSRDASSQ